MSFCVLFFFTYVHIWLVSVPLIQCLENKLFLISTVQSILKKSTLNIHWKDWCWSWSSIIWPPDVKSWLTGKDLDARKNWRQEEKGTTEDEMVVWYQQLNGHEFEQALGDSEGQGSLACCSPWGPKELDTTEWLNNEQQKGLFFLSSFLSLSFLFFMA